MFVYIVIGILAVAFSAFFYFKRPQIKKQSKVEPKDKAHPYMGEIMEKINRSEKMNKIDVKPKDKDASIDNEKRIAKIVKVLDLKIKEFNGSIYETQEWVKTNVSDISDAVHAGFYLGQMQTLLFEYERVHNNIFGSVKDEAVEDEEDVFEVVDNPKDKPVVVMPVSETKKKDVINEFLDQDKQRKNPGGKDTAAVEVA